MTDKLDIDHLKQWIGRTDEASDVITAQLVKGLRATLFLDIGTPKIGDAAPFTTHWCLAQPVAAMDKLGPDGHPARGGFLPPVPLPRRMWAGGEVQFIAPLLVGDEVNRKSTILDVNVKTGSTGTLCFVNVELVGMSPPAPAPKEVPSAQHQETHFADPVLLFRYSALTFNGHRIHYDREYVTKVEFYPGLVFHGPLQAALLVEFSAKLKGKAPAKFSYRGVSPLFDGADFTVNANEISNGLEVWTANDKGAPTMKATASW
jgi:3-methylfumaryl-CoA hydratase